MNIEELHRRLKISRRNNTKPDLTGEEIEWLITEVKELRKTVQKQNRELDSFYTL